MFQGFLTEARLMGGTGPLQVLVTLLVTDILSRSGARLWTAASVIEVNSGT